MFTTTKEILSKNKIVPACNFSTFEVAKAVVEACQELGQDVILQTSMSEANFLGLGVAVGIVRALGQRSSIAVSLHFDHAKDLEIIKDALIAGYTSLLADVSELGFEEGVELVRGIKGLKDVKGIEDITVEASLTEFERAAEFVEKTNPDLLAPFKIVNSEDVSEIDKIMLVRKFVSTPLVLHDGSSKSDEEIKKAISLGVVKINFNTCLREAWTKGLRQTLSSSSNEIKPYNILEPSVEAVKKVVEEKIKVISPKGFNYQIIKPLK